MIRAAVDIGTNTTRLLIIDVDGNDLARRYVVTGLGRGVDKTRTFRTDSVAYTLAVLSEYREAIDHHGVEVIRAIATSATRDVREGTPFLDAAERALGVRPEVISGDEEAELSFQDGSRGALGTPPLLTMDVGGGSTEFVYGTERPEYATSIDMGSVRLTERSLPDRPAMEDQVRAARLAAKRSFLPVQLPGPVGTGIGVGGTFTSLATLSLGLPFRTSVQGKTLTAEAVRLLVERLATLTIEGTAALEGIDPARAPVILGGAIVVERAMVATDLDKVLASEHDLLDGIALSLA